MGLGTATWKRLGGRLAATLLLMALAACYLPTRFVADITINKAGDWTLKFDGTLAAIGLVPGLMIDNPTPAEYEARVKNVTNDLARDPGFRNVEYLGTGQYRVTYERAGNLHAQAGVTFVRGDSRILSITYVKRTDTTTIRGATIPPAQRGWVKDAGLDMQGDVRITTDAEVVDHNATATQPGPKGATIYLWQIRGLDSPAPKLVIAG